MSATISNYAAWLLVCVVAMELLTHAAPAMAVAASGAYSKMAPLQLMMFCFVLLKLMWLKFLVIWRFFRLWALLDGVETPVRNQSARFFETVGMSARPICAGCGALFINPLDDTTI